MLSLPATTGPELVSRIKIMADMDIVERRRPQDGQFETTIDGAGVDVRVATGATIWGETAVLRLLDKSRSMKHLSELGMPTDTHERYLSIVRKPYGMIMCSGPTGSGKTTTLYATLAEITRSELNVMTIEDPGRVRLPRGQPDADQPAGRCHLRQWTQVDPPTRSRRDPRRRDPRRGDGAHRGAVGADRTRGHVVAARHRRDVGAVPPDRHGHRTVPDRVVARRGRRSATGAQDLPVVRRRRTSRSPRSASSTSSSAAQPRISSSTASAATTARDTGYRDRVGVYEVLAVTDEIRQLVVTAAAPQELRALAVAQGMRTMSHEAMALVAADITTIDEVIHNVYVN